MTLIVLFSGQGGLRREHVAQFLARPADALREAAQRALDDIGIADVGALDDAALAANAVAQPLICALQLAAWHELAPLLPAPALFGGYSLGELTAFAAAGAFPPADTVALAAQRARLMDAETDAPSGLLAVLGLPEATLARHCEAAGAEIAIRNGPTHFIVGGRVAALVALEAAALAAGASRATHLPVTTPSHTSILRAAGDRFADCVRPMLAARLQVPVLSGVGARVVRDPATALAALGAQMHTTLDWAACMDTIDEMRPDAVLEIGPGIALARMLQEAAPDLETRAVEEFRSAAAAAQWVRARAR